FEAEFTTSPWQGWEFLFGVSALDTTVQDITSVSFFTDVPTTRDREMVLAPDLELNGLGRYEWPLFGGMMAVQGDFHYVGEQFFDIANNPIATESSYVVGNARLAYTSGDQRWQAALWVKNLADTEYRSYVIPVTSLGFTQNMYGRPRWFGVTMSYQWD
ncbi:MAG: TonB-dependent receptor, partial [Phycisphaerales bacterium]|nr:TonB-dependent receptor [Phycisphaerales bacterium]